MFVDSEWSVHPGPTPRCEPGSDGEYRRSDNPPGTARTGHTDTGDHALIMAVWSDVPQFCPTFLTSTLSVLPISRVLLIVVLTFVFTVLLLINFILPQVNTDYIRQVQVMNIDCLMKA